MPRPPATDEALREFATAYREEVTEGRHGGMSRVADRLGISRVTTYRWVEVARARGFLSAEDMPSQHRPRKVRWAKGTGATTSWDVCAECRVPWPCPTAATSTEPLDVGSSFAGPYGAAIAETTEAIHQHGESTTDMEERLEAARANVRRLIEQSGIIQQEISEAHARSAETVIPDPRNRPWLTVAEVAEITGEGERVIRTAIDAGVIPHLQIGRYKRIPTSALRKLIGVPEVDER